MNRALATVGFLACLFTLGCGAAGDTEDSDSAFEGINLDDDLSTTTSAVGSGLIDVMDFFLPDPAKYPDGVKLIPTEGSSDQTQVSTTRFGNAIFRVKGSARNYEHWTYDSDYVYLKYDRTWGRQADCANSYEFEANSGKGGKWLKRHMKVNEEVSQVVSLRQRDERCHVLRSSDHGYYTRLEAFLPSRKLGALGTHDVIRVKYSGNGNVPYERFYFARNWGWIGWDYYDSADAPKPKYSVRWTQGYSKTPTEPVATCVSIPTKSLVPLAALSCGKMQTCQSLGRNDSIQSCDGRFKFILQNDGNLVLYRGTEALWNSHTNGQSAGAVEMQPDGNLVLYSSAGQALWASGTWTHKGATLSVQNDGNAVLYEHLSSNAAKAVWSTNTGGN